MLSRGKQLLQLSLDKANSNRHNNTAPSNVWSTWDALMANSDDSDNCAAHNEDTHGEDIIDTGAYGLSKEEGLNIACNLEIKCTELPDGVNAVRNRESESAVTPIGPEPVVELTPEDLAPQPGSLPTEEGVPLQEIPNVASTMQNLTTEAECSSEVAFDSMDPGPDVTYIPQTGRMSRLKTKENRIRGRAYVGFKRRPDGKASHDTVRSEKSIKPRCSHKNKDPKTEHSYLCAQVSDEQRLSIFREFWKLSTWQAKQGFISGFTHARHPRRRKHQSDTQKKNNSFDCYLFTEDSKKVLVCRHFFLGTLDLGRATFHHWLTKLQADDESNVEHHSDQRGQQKRNKVIEWLGLLPKVPSHYCRASTQRLYVESTFRSVLHMHSVYVEWCYEQNVIPVSRQSFNRVLTEQKVSIHKPKKDQCDICCEHAAGQLNTESHEIHMQKKDEARAAKAEAKTSANSEKLVVTMDLQSVLLAPKLLASAIYYKMKLQIHNFTVYELNNGDVTLYVWHEANGGVTGNEFTSCIVDYLSNIGQSYKHIVLISDGCTYQNRNKILSSALSDLAQRKNITIEQLYLEKGHTQMEADSVHATLEHYFKAPIYAPCDYTSLMRKARPQHPYTVKDLDYTFFRDFESVPSNFRSIRPGFKSGDPVVTNIRGILYDPSGNVKFKLRHSDPLALLPQRRPSQPDLQSQPTSLYSSPVKIKRDKFKHLQELKSLIPNDYHPFYDGLPHD